MSGEGLEVRWTKCPARLKWLPRTLSFLGFKKKKFSRPPKKAKKPLSGFVNHRIHRVLLCTLCMEPVESKNLTALLQSGCWSHLDGETCLTRHNNRADWNFSLSMLGGPPEHFPNTHLADNNSKIVSFLVVDHQSHRLETRITHFS